MIRKIIKIDEDKCNGCGLCAEACHEGAIGMVDGKRNFCAMITVTVWEIAYRFVQPVPLVLNAKRPSMTKPRFRKTS